MESKENILMQKAVGFFEKRDFIQGAEYLRVAYYEGGKSAEILSFFDEMFFKPNYSELQKIYDANIIKMGLEKVYPKFQQLPYYVIPIDSEYFYIYDKSTNDIIASDFTRNQRLTIKLCTDENIDTRQCFEDYEDEIKTQKFLIKVTEQIEKIKLINI